jgi:hypothetical protein
MYICKGGGKPQKVGLVSDWWPGMVIIHKYNGLEGSRDMQEYFSMCVCRVCRSVFMAFVVRHIMKIILISEL